MKWWEKTVEYYFIRKYVPEEVILSPLAGKHEAGGDLVTGDQDKWLLIEFKVNKSALKTEESKYKTYELTKVHLMGSDSHHFLVFGSMDTGYFDVRASTYFSKKELPDVEDIFNFGKPQSEFIDYLKEVIKAKKVTETGDGSSSGGFSLVAAVNGKNKVTKCMTLKEFGLEYSLNLKPELSHSEKLKQSRSKSMGFSR